MSVFDRAQGLKPRRSRINLSYAKAFDCDAGQLIPTFVRYMVPGDIFQLRQEIVIRPKGPLLAPAFAEVNAHSYAFFCPLRILHGSEKEDQNGWLEYDIDDHYFEKFITGGRDGNISLQLPAWQPDGSSVVNDNWNGLASGSPGSNLNDVNVTVVDNGIYSLWDYMEMPLGWSNTNGTLTDPSSVRILDYKRRMYAMVWNEWFRDENVMPPVSILSSNKVLNACWKKDYFTSMLPWQQRGPLPSVPVTGQAPVLFSSTSGINAGVNYQLLLANAALGFKDQSGFTRNSSGTQVSDVANQPFFANLNASNNIGFDINQLRLAFQIQRWQELNARCGSRYVEFLKANFGTSPTDDTLQRPMFIGGSKTPIIISEVLQTAADGNEGVGSLAGHSIAADSNKITRFRANEYGLMMVLTVIKPKAMYHQGFDPEDMYQSRFDFFNCAFVNLSEQAVFGASLYATGEAADDDVIVGFQGRYNELRTAHDKICGALRGDQALSYWVSARTFADVPVLNGQFLKCNPNKDLFSVKDEPAWIVMVNNRCTAFRPMPYMATPGLIDHLYGERR